MNKVRRGLRAKGPPPHHVPPVHILFPSPRACAAAAAAAATTVYVSYVCLCACVAVSVAQAYHGIVDLGPDPRRVHLDMDIGDTVFFHSLLIHGSGTNRTSGFRKVRVCDSAAGAAVVALLPSQTLRKRDPGGLPLSRVPCVRVGRSSPPPHALGSLAVH